KSVTVRLDSAGLDQLISQLRNAEQRVQSIAGNLQQLNSLCVDLMQSGQTLHNLDSARESLQLCLPVLDAYSRLRAQMNRRQPYHALKTLERLEHSLLPLLPPYAFTEAIRRELPRIREQIREASENELKDYLVGVRGDRSRLVGAIALRLVAQQAGLAFSMLGSSSEPLDHGEGSNIDDLLDFSPVYRCLNIHTVLGEKARFQQYYRNQRSYQCTSMLQMSPLGSSRVNYAEFFAQFVGFFVVEDNLHHTMPDMVTREFLNELWQNALEILTRLVRARLSDKLENTDALLDFKKYIQLLLIAMRSYGYRVALVSDLIKEMQAKYFRVLQDNYRPMFQHIFADDNYTAMLLQNAEDYKASAQVLDLYPFSSAEFDSLPYPKRTSFSQMVPLVYSTCAQFVDECLCFHDGASADAGGTSNAELEDSLSKAINDLLAYTVRDCFKERLRELHLPELIQMIVNVEALEEVCDRLEAYTMQRLDSGGVKLHGKAVFKDCQAECESFAYEKMKEQVNKMISLAEYDWDYDPIEAGHTSSGNHGQQQAQSAQNLQRSSCRRPSAWVAQTACLISCKHVHEELLGLVMDPQVRSIGPAVLLQLSSDIACCKAFATNSPTLCMAFEELSQLLRLVVSNDWQVFLRECQTGPRSRYDRVTVSKAVQLLEKVREFDRRKGSFLANFRSKQRQGD
uniref:Sec15 domain-containing protein n=1 Tax=Macrostomum lignano TaxID=282301 RepID=A0A1I8JQU1_9PLAT